MDEPQKERTPSGRSINLDDLKALKKIRNGNGFRIKQGTLITLACILVAATVYIVTGIVGLNARMNSMEKNMDRLEQNSANIVTYLGMKPAKK